MAALNPNAAEWVPPHLQPRPIRPDSRQIRITYIIIIDEYKRNLDKECQQSGYNTTNQWIILDETYSFCKTDFQRYIQNGIDNQMFENWFTNEDDLIPIMNMAIHMLRPQHEHIIRNTYIRIIDSYRLRLEVEYQQTGYCPEQSIYNTTGRDYDDVDEAFNNVDKRDVQLYAKDFRGYVRHGIWGSSFPSWLSEEFDLVPIVYMAINDNIHNITKRVFVNDGDGDQVAREYYCLGAEGEKVELSSDLLDLAEQVTGRISNDEEDDDIT